MPVKLIQTHGFAAGLAGALAVHRASSAVGSFVLSPGDCARVWGHDEATWKRALAKLEGATFLVRAGGPGTAAGGARVHWHLGPAATEVAAARGLRTSGGGVQFAPPGMGGLNNDHDLKGGAICTPPVAPEAAGTAADLRHGLLAWDMLASDADAVLAAYPAWWIAAKLSDLAGRVVKTQSRYQYAQVALAGYHVSTQREAVKARVDAARTRSAMAGRGAALRVQVENGERLRQAAARANEAAALAWFAALAPEVQADVGEGWLSSLGEFGRQALATFDPEANPWCRGATVAAWWDAVRESTWPRSAGVDVQRDGRLPWAVVGGGWVIGWGVEVSPAGLASALGDMGPAAGLVDEGDGQTCRLARDLARELGGSGGTWATWKGYGGEVDDADRWTLQAMGTDGGRLRGVERAWAGKVLADLASGALRVSPDLCGGDDTDRWTELAGRESADVEATGPDHTFDAVKLAMASAQLIGGETETNKEGGGE